MLDFDAYLRRIGLAPEDAPSWQAVHRAHATAIPFENLDSHLGIPVSLEQADLERKLVDDRRGGYCFEHNLLLTFVSGLIVSVNHDDGRREVMFDWSGPLVTRTMSPDRTETTDAEWHDVPSLLAERFGLPGFGLGPDGRLVALP